MKEGVHQPKSGFLAGVAVVGIGIAYFFFLSTSEFQEPGATLEYNIEEFESLDKIPTNFAEETAIAVDIPDPNALAVSKENVYVSGENKIAIFGNDGALAKTLDVPGTPISNMAPAADGGLYVGMKDKVLGADAETGSRPPSGTNLPRAAI